MFNTLSAKDMEQHVKVVGWLQILVNAGLLLLAACMSMMLVGAGLASGEFEGMAAMGIMSAVLGGIMAFMALPGILAGMGLLQGKNWARILAVVLALMALFSFPFGTALGAYTLWVLFQAEATPYFAPVKIG